MAKRNIGRVLMLPKDEWSSTTSYERLDIVSYEGSSYVCKADCRGIAVTNTEYWQYIAKKGDKGETGNSGVYIGAGDIPEDYNLQIDPSGDVLSSQDIIDSAVEAMEKALEGKADRGTTLADTTGVFSYPQRGMRKMRGSHDRRIRTFL